MNNRPSKIKKKSGTEAKPKNNADTKAEAKQAKSTSKPVTSGSYGRAMASLFLSVINYGWNVATRPPLPEVLQKQYGYKETGRKTLEPGQQETYLRMEAEHPGRDILKIFIALLELDSRTPEKKRYLDAANELRKQLPALGFLDHDRVNEFIKKLDKSIKSEDRKKILGYLNSATQIPKQDKHSLKFGRLLTPEQCLESVFAILPNEMVDEIFDTFITPSIGLTLDLIDLPQHSVNASGVVKSAGAVTPVSYTANIDERVAFIGKFQSSVKKLKLDHFQIIQDNNEYPCITFDCKSFIKKIPGKLNKDMLTHFITAAFCGLVNYYSIQKYGANFIWTATQNSFGSIRPSLTDTDQSFRLSPGLAPEGYEEVIINAIRTLDTMIEGFAKDISNNETPARDSLFVTKNRTTMHVEFLKLLADAAKHTTPLDATQLIALYHQSAMRQSEEVSSRKSDEVLPTLIANTPSVPCNAPPFAVNALTALVTSCRQQLNSKQTGIKCLSKTERVIEGQLRNATHAAEQLLSQKSGNPDYSLTCSCIEQLTRLLKMKHDLAAIVHYYKNPYKPGHRRTLSADVAYPSVGGMASLADIILCLEDTNIVMKFEGDKYFEFHNVDPHNIRNVTPSLLTPSTEAKSKSAAPKAANSNSDDTQPAAESLKIMIADISPFPYKSDMLDASKSLISQIKVNKPDILILDITTTKPEMIAALITALQKESANKPAYIITFASDHKISQLVDLVPMGEIRVFNLTNEANPHRHAEIDKVITQLKATLTKRESEYHADTISAESARKTFEALGTRRTMKTNLTMHGTLHAPQKKSGEENSTPIEEMDESKTPASGYKK